MQGRVGWYQLQWYVSDHFATLTHQSVRMTEHVMASSSAILLMASTILPVAVLETTATMTSQR